LAAPIYLNLLNRTGLSVLILQVRWYTCAFNRWFFRLAQWRTQFWRYWFSAGIYFGIIAMVGSVVVLVIVIYNSFRQKSMEQQVLTPVVRMYPTEFCVLCYVNLLIPASVTILFNQNAFYKNSVALRIRIC
jgi:hypothetical protein